MLQKKVGNMSCFGTNLDIPVVMLSTFPQVTCALLLVGVAFAFGTVGHVQKE